MKEKNVDHRKAKNRNEAKLCGAHSRQTGNPCRNYRMKGRKRCKFHGGRNNGNPNVKTNPPALKHGIYSKRILEDEYPILFEINKRLGTLDEEIAALRVLLCRAFKESKNFELAQEDLATVESTDEYLKTAISHKLALKVKTEKTEYGKNTTYQIPNPSDKILKITNLIMKLEQARKALMTENFSEGDATNLANALRQFSKNADETVPIRLGSGNYPGLN